MRVEISNIPAWLVAVAVFVQPVLTLAQDRLPDGGIAEGMGIRAWYEDPTERYGHGILGDGIEAETLAIDAGGTIHRHTLAADSVFEDLTPRIVDIDGDGMPEVLTIKTYLGEGATVAIYGIGPDGIAPLGEADPIGTPNRWLNPAGVADYDGDGIMEIAVVRTPHIGGILILYHWDGDDGRLVEELRQSGYSTHAIGSRDLDLAFSYDWNGDGIADLLLPDQRRTHLIALSFAGGTVVEIDRYNIRREIAGGMEMMGNFLRVPLTGGPARTLTRPYSEDEKDH
ncbi:MAG: VCBS repeat-containing protein [Alphaproteobacteria bacterium]